MLVVDASAAVELSFTETGFSPLETRTAVAPSLLWSEAPSAIHELRWRGAASDELATGALTALMAAPISVRRPKELPQLAWEVADLLGWAKTYDAEYVALARLLDCPLLTVDRRLRLGAARVVEVLGPAEL